MIIAAASAETISFDPADFRPGVFVHHKGGRYLALFLAERHTHNGDLDVIYTSLAHGKQCTRPWARDSRDEDSWTDPVRWPDGVIRARFMPASASTEEALPGPVADAGSGLAGEFSWWALRPVSAQSPEPRGHASRFGPVRFLCGESSIGRFVRTDLVVPPIVFDPCRTCLRLALIHQETP